VDQHGQVIDVYVSGHRDITAARTFFTTALTVHGEPAEVITDRAPALANVIDDLIPGARHNTMQHENNRVECDHGRLKAGLRPMRGLKTNRTALVAASPHVLRLANATAPRCPAASEPCRRSVSVIGPMLSLALEREDGTLLRLKGCRTDCGPTSSGRWCCTR